MGVSEFPLSGNHSDDSSIIDQSLERHYSPEDISGMWGLSVRTVRRLFANEPGIIELGQGETLQKRRYFTIRIPESVLARVHRRLRKTG